MSQPYIAEKKSSPDFPEWGLFCDFHTMRDCKNIGAALDIPLFIAALRRCGIDFLTIPARCNQGFSYYKTTMGIPHPGTVDDDLFGKIVSSCREAGIFISGYVNIGISVEEWLQHSDWRVIPPEGVDYGPLMCVNSKYADHLCAMTEEIVQNYDVTGMFFDCVFAPECTCSYCREKNLSPQESRKQIISRVSAAVRKHRPDAMIYFNSMPAEDQLDDSNYLELECLPNGGWSYDSFPMLARYLRNFDRPVFGMSGRFHRSWGDFGGLRNVSSLTYDCASALAHGLRVTVGTHLHPTLALNKAVINLIADVYDHLRPHSALCRGAVPKTEISAMIPGKNLKENTPENMASAYGASRILQELGMQFNIITPEMPIPSGCRLLILADNVRLTEEQAQVIRKFIADGGAVIATGCSGMLPDEEKSAIPELGVLSRKTLSEKGHFIRSNLPGFPDMPIASYSGGAVYTPVPGSKIRARGEAAVFELPQQLDSQHIYLPPGGGDEGVVMAKTGQCIYCTIPLLADYFHFAQLPFRDLLRGALLELLPEPLTDTTKLPQWVKTTVTEQPGRSIIHLLSYIPERRGECFDVVDCAIPVHNAVVKLRRDGNIPERVYLSPEREKMLPFTVEDKYLRITVPEFSGYAVIAVEWKNISK